MLKKLGMDNEDVLSFRALLQTLKRVQDNMICNLMENISYMNWVRDSAKQTREVNASYTLGPPGFDQGLKGNLAKNLQGTRMSSCLSE